MLKGDRIACRAIKFGGVCVAGEIWILIGAPPGFLCKRRKIRH